MTAVTAEAVPDPAWVRWSAAQTVRQHEIDPMVSWRTGCCSHCQPARGCPMLAWAQQHLDAQAGGVRCR